ncbi:hypothetical protein LJC72_09495 [Bacteroides sp. OttesenSCG-928-D19]|nr:hypothetical protein [Bacteroides sp. OttesenSCG-928-D19]
MKIRSLLFSVWCVLVVSCLFTACSDDDNNLIDDGSTLELPKTRAYFLNSGKMGLNNAGITFYAPNGDHDKIDDIFMTQNKKGLGDTGQDIIKYKDYIYVTVYGSKLLVKLNSACVEQQKSLSFSEEDGSPRHLVEVGGKLYVTLYGGKVAKINPDDLTIEGYVTVGKNPEEIAVCDGHLYVVNSGLGTGTTLTVIDVKTFTVAKTIDVAYNPEGVLASEGQVFVRTYGGAYPDYTYAIQKVSFTGDTTTVARATRMCEYNGTIYFVYGDTNWDTYETTNTFFSYNVKTGTLTNRSFLTDMPAELTSKSVYMMEINPNNGDIYIGTSDYTTNGDIYRFDRTGKFVEKFESGINPFGAVFF